MYYEEKFENNKWYKRHSPKGKWYEFNELAYKNKAIELQQKLVNKNNDIHSVSNCTDTKVFEAARDVVDCEGSYYSRCKEAIHYLDELVRIMSEIEDANDTV